MGLNKTILAAIIGSMGGSSNYTQTIPGTAIFENLLSASDHGAINGAGAVKVYEIIDGVNVFSLTNNVSSTFNAKTFSQSIPNGQLTLAIHVDDISTLSSLQVDVATESGYANYYRCQINQGSGFGWNGWYNIVIDPPAEVVGGVDYTSLSGDAAQRRWAKQAGSPNFDSSTFTNMRIVMAPQSGLSCKISIAGAWIAEKNNVGNISIIFDDNYDNVYTNARPIMESYGLRCSMAVIANTPGLGGYMTLGQMQSMIAGGHECIVHGATALSTITAGDVSAIQAEVAAHQNYVINNGLANNGSQFSYVYPLEAYSSGSGTTRNPVAIAQALSNLGIVIARAGMTSGLLINKYAKAQIHYIAGVGHRYATGTDDSANTARVIQRIKQACALGRGVVLSFHKCVVTPTQADTLEISTTNFALICAAIKAEIDAGRARNVLFTNLATDINSRSF